MDLSVETQGNPPKPEIKSDRYLFGGYIMLIASFILFVLLDNAELKRDEFFTVFVIHYLFACFYGVALLIEKSIGVRKSWKKENIGKTVVLINMFLISAYALNREIPVFEESTDWLCVYLVCASFTLLSYQYFDKLPRWVNCMQHFFVGSAIVLYVYLAFYIAQIYVIGSVGMLFFGIGGHVFVPVILLATCIVLVHRNETKAMTAYAWLSTGCAVTILVAAAFIVEWSKRVDKIETLANQSVLYAESELPAWLKVGQIIPNDWITERILKSDLVYTTQKDKFGSWNFMPVISWEEAREHDPLVLLATLRTECTLPGKERVKILQAITDARHKANERLWSGDNLVTSYVVTDIDIFPDLRLAYTEKYLTIKNEKRKGRWGNTEEAIYTFQLPEGSVVTSLSLWINGKEEKGILTSQQKASKAYSEIVGVERRDPSVIHWQEGNTVTVRVFPCTPDDERKFKMGITSPLIHDSDEVRYENIAFRGPNPHKAKETTRIRMHGGPAKIELPDSFTKDSKGDYLMEGEYDPEFEIAFENVPLKTNNRFVFDGFRYGIEPYEPTYQSVALHTIYLDINSSWKKNELDSFKTLVTDKQIFVCHQEEFIRLTPENWGLTDELTGRNFSLFPFHRLTATEHTLVVTKGHPLSPQLKDFKDSKFAMGIGNFFASGKKAYVYNIGTGASTYIRSLRELRALEFANGTTNDLLKLLKDNRYPETIENDGRVVLHDARMCISKQKIDSSSVKSNAPDHLARLFAYNHIMSKVGVNFFKADYTDEVLVDEAATAYVVSPVSSLIVLETQEDYKRFGIADKDNSLHNAAKQSSGAVPEPHEWALIILFVLFVVFLKIRN
jgi:XrtN system VIT domain protein